MTEPIDTHIEKEHFLRMRAMVGDRKFNRVLDIGCFPPKTKILKPNLELVNIENIKEGDCVLTDKGNVGKVIKKLKRIYNNYIYTIEGKGYVLSSTIEHPILAVKKEKVVCPKCISISCNTNGEDNICTTCNNKNKGYEEPLYIPICDLSVGDYFAIPKNINISEKDINESRSFAIFLGLYLSQGHLIYSHKPKICGIGLTFHKRFTNIIPLIKEVCNNLPHTSIKYNIREKKNTLDIRIYGKKLAEMVLDYCGKYAGEKCISNKIFSWNNENQELFISNYFLGDGHYRIVKNRGEQYAVKTKSPYIFHKLTLLLNRLGISPSSKRYGDYYSTTLSGIDVNFLLNRNKGIYPSRKRYRLSKDYIFIPIDKIKKEIKKCLVYNMHIDKDNTYVANGLCVHNCGDGTLTSLFRDCAKKIVAYDRLEHQILKAKSLYPEIDFQVKDMEKTIFTEQNDLVIFCDSIYYLTLKTQRRVMVNIFATLSDDGYLLTSRHLGGGNAEFDIYLGIFEPIKSEWVPCIGNPQKWYITLWRKRTEGIRDISLIKEHLWKTLLGEYVDFTALGVLYYTSLIKSSYIISNLVKNHLEKGRNLNSTYFLTLCWLLELEKQDCWTDFQEIYHEFAKGNETADFRAVIMLEWMGKGNKVLDVGVHNGVNTNEFAKDNTVIGIDLPKIVEKFKSKFNFECKVGDINTDMGMFESDSFDVVIAGEIIEHLTNPSILINEAYRVLKTNGLMLISCPYENVGPGDSLHCNCVNEEWLREKFGNKFVIEEVKENLKKEKGCLLAKCRKR